MRRALAIVALLTASTAHAHEGALTPLAPFVVDDVLVGGSTTWGIVLIEGGRSLRVCEEATGMQTAVHRRTPGGAVLVGGVNGLLRTQDGGCSFTAPTGLVAGSEVTSIAAHDARIFVSTGRTGFPNGIYLSDDDGRTFITTAISGSASPYFDVFAADDGTLYASGFDIDTELPLLQSSDRDAQVWTSASFDLSPYVGVRAVASSLIAATALDGSGVLLEVTPALNGAIERARFPTPISHAAEIGQVLLVVAFPGALYLGEDALDIEASCVFAIDGVFWACGSTTGPLDDVHFARSTDGVQWTSFMDTSDIEERECAAGTPGSQCPQYLPDAGVIIAADGGVVEEEPPPSPPSTMGCASAGSALFWVLLLALKKRGPIAGSA